MGKLWRSIVLACVAACMAFVLVGCASDEVYEPQSKSPAVTAPVIGEDGVLRVGVNTGNPPLAGMGSEKIIGLDVDIAAAIADELGLKVSIVDVGSDPGKALAEGAVDIVMGIDEADADGTFWLSEDYMPTGVALFASSADAGVPVSGDGSLIAAQVSSKSAWAVANEFGEDGLVALPNLNDAFAELSAGTANYVAADAIIGLYAARTQGIEAHVAALLLAPSGYCVGVSMANVELQEYITTTLGLLYNGGVIDVIECKWLGTALDLSNVPMTAGKTVVPTEDEKADEPKSEEESEEPTE